ncbi:MAG: hypothetical protein ACWGQW_16470, partial [bacterium]
MDSYWEQLLTEPPDNIHVTMQPSGVSDEADWVHLLDSGYYENLMELKRAEFKSYMDYTGVEWAASRPKITPWEYERYLTRA